MERLLLRVGEVAELLGIGRTTAYGLIKAGELPTVRVGRSRRVSRHALQAWVAKLPPAARGKGAREGNMA